MHDAGLFGPGSITWHIHSDPAVLVGGLRALLVQALSPRAMAAVHDFSDYRTDPWGRFRRTSDYLAVTIFGDTRTAEAAGARVRALHRRVRGVDEHTGLPYSADDPELLLWIHAVEVDSFLTSYRTFAGHLADADADRYVEEMVRSAALVGLHPGDVPHTVDDLRTYLRAQESRLEVSEAARQGMQVVLHPPMPAALRPLWAVPTAAAVAIMPDVARTLYGLRWPRPATPLVRLAVFSASRALQLALPGPPALREARARLRRAAA